MRVAFSHSDPHCDRFLSRHCIGGHLRMQALQKGPPGCLTAEVSVFNLTPKRS